jgi:hypothetical protein
LVSGSIKVWNEEKLLVLMEYFVPNSVSIPSCGLR